MVAIARVLTSVCKRGVFDKLPAYKQELRLQDELAKLKPQQREHERRHGRRRRRRWRAHVSREFHS